MTWMCIVSVINWTVYRMVYFQKGSLILWHLHFSEISQQTSENTAKTARW